MSQKMETALQFPTGADLKDLEEVEGDFSGESHFYEFAFISNPWLGFYIQIDTSVDLIAFNLQVLHWSMWYPVYCALLLSKFQ